jgi:8-oxo-dGTP pyrophosphatase MutT (NUDIX family)
MQLEHSAGGVVVREREGVLEVAVIQPTGRQAVALPKGHLNPGESSAETAAREVGEETGLQVSLLADLGVIHYHYRFRGRLIDKTVDFFLFRFEGGEVDQVTPEMRVEVAKAFWVPLDEAPRLLSYPGERDMVKKALMVLPRDKISTGANGR